ncbi:MAG: hypothetical protein IT462_16290 [Planctomycetes bacterium]|nr:hypothetical protein [Planctomycetota bacterium]
MTLAQQLLEVARSLLAAQTAGTEEAQFRRAVSTAYYAVFHRLIEKSAEMLRGQNVEHGLFHVIARAFDHTAMKHLANAMRGGTAPEIVNKVIKQVPDDLRTVAENFVDLQLARHDADYALAENFDAARGTRALQQADAVFSQLDHSSPSPELVSFLTILPMWPQLKKRSQDT